jgi:glycosyltransferase involved in cell wall biosynthesis
MTISTFPDTPPPDLRACWIGNHRYSQPLNATDAKKWALFEGLGEARFVVAFAEGIRPRRFDQHARFYLLPALPVSLLRYATMFTLGTLLLLALVLLRGVRVIVAQSPFEGAMGAVVKLTARLFGVRVALAVESHGDFEVGVLEHRRVSLPGLYRTLMRAAARFGLRHADLLRPVSSSARAQLERYAPNTPQIQFMTWTDADAFKQTVRVQPPSACTDLVYAGTLIPRKGVHILLDAFARIAAEQPAAQVWLVGKDENAEYAAALRQQTQRLGLTERVHFVGMVPQSELAGYMARGRGLVLDSLSEGLPRVVIEAMLNGLPVIASRVSGTPDVITDDDTGYLIPPDDVEALVGALRALYANPDLDGMGQRAQTFARAFFSTDSYRAHTGRLLAAAASLR